MEQYSIPYDDNDLLPGQSLSGPASPSLSNLDSLDEEFWAPRSGPASQPPAPAAPEAQVASEATPAPTPHAATLSEQGLHKRQISEAIPREERENERTEGSQEMPQRENARAPKA